MKINELILKVFAEQYDDIAKAQQLIWEGDLLAAESLYKKMLDQNPANPPALHGLADLANAIDDQEVRAELLQRAIDSMEGQEDRNSKGVMAIWYSELAEALIKLGQQDEAKICIRASEKIISENLAPDH